MLSANWLAPDPLVPQRDRLLDPLEMHQRLSALYDDDRLGLPAAVRVKYRVGDSLRVLYRIPVAGAEDMLVSARTGAAGSRASEVPGAIAGVRRSGSLPPVAAIPDLRTTFWRFPCDRGLHQIDEILRPSAELSAVLDGAWTRSRLVGYAPAKSAVVACLGAGTEPLAFAKLYASPQHAARAFGVHGEMWKSSVGRPGLRLPRPLALSRSGSVVVSEAARGTRLTDCGPAEARRNAALLGAATAQMHAMDVTPMAPSFRRMREPGLWRAADVIGTARPDLSATVESLAGALAASAPDERGSVLLHGDIHLKNALIDRDGLWLIDLDQAGRGPAAADIGSFLALMRSRAVAGLLSWDDLAVAEREFIEGYAAVRRPPAQHVIDWYTSAALLGERALRAISRMRLPLLETLDALVAEAHYVLRRGEHQ